METTETNRTAEMSFGEFVNGMQDRIQARYPECNVRTVRVDKNNGVHLTGIIIMPEEQNVAPNIYMENLYVEYLAGRQMEDLAAAAAQLYEERKIEEDLWLPDLTDFEAVRDLICFNPVNGERNRELLKSMPHRQFLDLAVTYYIPVTVSSVSDGRIAVKDRHFGMWGVDEETLYRHAVENTRRMLPVELRSLEEVVREILSEEYSGTMPPGQTGGVSGIPMYILRCGKGEQATAAAFLYEPVLQEFAKQHGDFYILPSSVFEVMLLPVDSLSEDSAYYLSMVREINRMQRSPDEVLSDNIYLCHADTEEIEILS